MSRVCSLTGKRVLTGNNVSHSNRKTRRRFLPNLQKTSFYSDIMGGAIRVRVAASTIRTVEHKGGIDNFLLQSPARKLTDDALRLKRKLRKRLAAQEVEK